MDEGFMSPVYPLGKQYVMMINAFVVHPCSDNIKHQKV